MTIHIQPTDRTLLPRALIKRPTCQTDARILRKTKALVGAMNAADESHEEELASALIVSMDTMRERASWADAATPATIARGAWQPPASLPPRVIVKRWKFRIGARVVFGGMPATIVSRDSSWFGRQIYCIHIAGESYGRPVRLVQAPYLERLSE